MAIDDKVRSKEGKKPKLTTDDFKQYIDMLRPYQEKVNEKKELLTSEDIKDIERIKRELIKGYSSQSLTDSRIYGIIGTLVGIDRGRKTVLREEELDREDRRLSGVLRTGRENRTLSYNEEKGLCNRINQIRYQLDPYHFRGSKPA